MTIDSMRALVQEDFAAVNALIVSKIQNQVSLAEDLSTHIVASGGKRLRPLLVLLASKACGYSGDKHIKLAATIELIHTATLLHDDVVDDSTLRRGRQTANSIWGSKASILVGDYLFTLAMQLLVEAGNSAILDLITDTAFKISCGEVKQLANRNNPQMELADYYEVIAAKTSILFSAASSIGGLLAETEEPISRQLAAYGLHLGNAFQLIDDALDYCSDAKTLGKNIGDDLADGKATLPLIHALQYGNEQQKAYITESLQRGTLDYLPEILTAIEETGAIAYTQKVATQEIEAALNSLTGLAPSPYKSALIDLAHFAANRSF